jgi:hypothetical protein
VVLLLRAGADVNAKPEYSGDTCLEWASEDVDLVRLLIKHGGAVTYSVLYTTISGIDWRFLRRCCRQIPYLAIAVVKDMRIWIFR